MAELLSRIRELQSLDHGCHWFCERIEVLSTHSDRDSKAEIEVSSNYRRDLVIECLMIFSYDGSTTVTPKEYLSKGIDEQLGRCDVCIIEYYKAKRKMLDRLREDGYEDDQIETFADIFDDLSITRIIRGLDDAALTLRNLPPQKQRKDALERHSLMAMFEGLSCEKFLASEVLLHEHFEEPFRLCQTNGRLSLTHYVPAMTAFLFDGNQDRCAWAMQSWAKMGRSLTKEDFEFAVRNALSKVLSKASSPITDLNFVQRLWYGMKLVVDKLDADLITHSLRAMDIDVCRLALDHLQIDTAGFRFLLQTMELLLRKGPKDFWDAMGAISPQTVIEQVFNNPQFDKTMLNARNEADFALSAMKDLLSWVEPFMSSLQALNQPPACRSLSFQLLERLQANRFPVYARTECYRSGLEVLTWTLAKNIDEGSTFDAVGRAAAQEILSLITSHLMEILDILSSPSGNEQHIALAMPCSNVVRSALALECKFLRTDQENLQRAQRLPHNACPYSPTIWEAVVQAVHPGKLHLTVVALSGLKDFMSLETLSTTGDTKFVNEKNKCNAAFEHLNRVVCQMLERINDFGADDLDALRNDPKTSLGLVSSLFSAEGNVYESGINLIKTMSGQPVRRDAIRFLLEPSFTTTLSSFTSAIRQISLQRTFASHARMLKTCGDIINILCDSQDGLLRGRSTDDDEKTAVAEFWAYQWQSLKVIYEMTEAWSSHNNRQLMKEFCRDTMQFSAQLFDQYVVFASAVGPSGRGIKEEDWTPEYGQDQDASAKELLHHPSQTMEAMVNWLRLRDEYLASTSVSLIRKVLGQLSTQRMVLSSKPVQYLERVVTAQTRTILSEQEKAELSKALEDNLGRPIQPADADPERSDRSRSQSTHGGDSRTPKIHISRKPKAGTIDMQAWASAAKSTAPNNLANLNLEDEYDSADALKKDIHAASSSVEKFKQQQAAKAASLRPPGLKSVSLQGLMARKGPTEYKSESQKRADQASFREKREKEILAKKQRDLEAAARIKKNIPTTIAGQTAGEGSALGNLGVLGKDHGLKGSGMMVSSDSDSDSDDSIDRELFGAGRIETKVSAAVRDYNASKRKQAHVRGPIKKTKIVRSAKDMRARLIPDLSPLHRSVLSWDLFHAGDFPPNSQQDDYNLVANSFRTAHDYQKTFEPLLLLEAWQGFVQTKEEGFSKFFPIKIVNRLSVDSLIEVSTTMDMADYKEMGIIEADIILFSRTPKAEAEQPHCLARVFKVTRKKQMAEITLRFTQGNSLVTSLLPNASLYGTKIGSVTPLEREYGALLGLVYYDLCDEIIKATPSPLLKYPDDKVGRIANMYQLNGAQAKAVQSAVDNDAFTLIQGPPGSGKTKTICAIVGALLTDTLKDVGAIPVIRPSLSNGIGRPVQPVTAAKKVLVCAPSNAAVDELVMRLMEGVKTYSGERHMISVIRLGRSDRINPKVAEVTLDELVNKKMNTGVSKAESSGNEMGKIMSEHKATCEQLSALRATIDEVNSKGRSISPEQARELEVLKRSKQQLSNRIDQLRDSGNTAARDAEISRRHVQQQILDGAHVLCATLSGSGHDMFQNLKIDFETVIIDEAAQSVELSALIPLKYGCQKCIMVGDPKQLPPTVLSREAARYQYQQSLFVRMQINRPEDVHLLDTQYRMHPEISQFPSRAFYDGKLLDGRDMASLRQKAWHGDQYLGPYRFFDVQGQHQSAPKGHSLTNIAELEVALQLFRRLRMVSKDYDFTGKVGIITPYKSQLARLKERFQGVYGEDIFKTVEFNTTDAFQGRESEVIIFSCVRASGRGIGFLSDIRRMNVGITRAKCSLWVLGNSQSLMQGEFWNKLIQDAKQRDRYTAGNVMQMLQQPAPAIPTPQKQAGIRTQQITRDLPSRGASSAGEEMDVDDKAQNQAMSPQPENTQQAVMSSYNEAKILHASRTPVTQPKGKMLENQRPSANPSNNDDDKELQERKRKLSLSSSGEKHLPRKAVKTETNGVPTTGKDGPDSPKRPPTGVRPPMMKRKEPNIFIPKKRK